MMARKGKFFDWNSMDQAQRLGWVWLGLFWVLILTTAGAILYPAYKKWQAESEEEGKRGSLRAIEYNMAYAAPKGMSDGLVGVDCGAGSTRRVPHATCLG